MTNDAKKTPDFESLNDAMLSLREEYEETAELLAEQPEPKVGKELRSRRWPRFAFYLMGVLAVGMLVAAVFLFNAQGESELGAVELSETAVDPGLDDRLPTPELFIEATIPNDAIAPPPENTFLPEPPEPTPFPTPPIILDDPPG